VCDTRWPGRARTVPFERKSMTNWTRARIDLHRITGPFDVIVASDVLEHTLDTMSILLHLYDQLSDGGFFFINYPHYIEGDWHTPEAFYLRQWCMRFLFRIGDYESANVWRKRTTTP